MDKSFVANLRKQYNRNELIETNVSADVFEQFTVWFADAVDAGIKEPNAMVLSTVNANKPRSRVVLLKGFDKNGFSFYTNYESQKGNELAINNFASLNFFWDVLERQIRIEGEITKLSEAESDTYYWSRPRESQIGAWVSEQSRVIESRDILDKNLEYYQKKFEDIEVIPRPNNWGGYNLNPDRIEFWQGRPSRLHDRLLYTKIPNGWQIDRLSP